MPALARTQLFLFWAPSRSTTIFVYFQDFMCFKWTSSSSGGRIWLPLVTLSLESDYYWSLPFCWSDRWQQLSRIWLPLVTPLLLEWLLAASLSNLTTNGHSPSAGVTAGSNYLGSDSHWSLPFCWSDCWQQLSRIWLLLVTPLLLEWLLAPTISLFRNLREIALEW
jgi:hypothetical protein